MAKLFFLVFLVQYCLFLSAKADFENSWTMYMEQPCCSGLPNHHVRHHRALSEVGLKRPCAARNKHL
ncbi:hypothetical protein YQE_05104, partial [Dendroctonus ponderosae]